jgi:hypothetical protein
LGHSTGTSLDLYIDKKNVAKTLPAANALHRWHSVYAKVVLPQLESLGAEILPQIESLMTAMYTVSFLEFKPGNRLYLVLKICTASIIMHHIDFEINCLPQNRVSSTLRAAAARAKIVIQEYPKTWDHKQSWTSGVSKFILTFKINLICQRLKAVL